MKTDNALGIKHKGEAKTARIPIKVVQLEEKLKKPEWIRAKMPGGQRFMEIKQILREQKLHTVHLEVFNYIEEQKKKVNKGAWRMPWLLEAMKDVISCDKLRVLANTN